MPSTIAEFLDLLDLEVIEDNLFRGRQPATSLQRVFGGQVAAHALVAASRTVDEEYVVHSLHSYFLRPGDTAVPIVYDVEDVRDGGSFTTRRVAARQHGAIIFYMTASFQKEEQGFDHQDPMPGDIPPPEECELMSDIIRNFNPGWADAWQQEWSSAEVRMVPITDPATQRVWIRLAGVVEDRRPLRASLLTYFSDLTLLAPTLVPHGKIVSSPDVQVASLDHSIWFHRATAAGQWFLYDQHSPSASGGRGLSIARVFSQAGELVASIAQEGLIRPRREP